MKSRSQNRENNLASHVFTPARITVLKLLASQATISLENAHLYTDLDQAPAYLSEAQRLSRTGSLGWIPSRGEIIWSSETYRIFDYDPAIKPTVEMVLQRVHPEDRSSVEQLIERASRTGENWNLDHRLLMPDGSVKHLHVVAHAAENDSRGEVCFVGAVMDVTAVKQSQQALEQAFREIKTLKDQLQSENTVLREEFDKASMFEQIVGTSQPLRTVLSRISKVAPTDSSVLITGETGTGKELVARAIHRRSRRSARAFVSVNCAAIPCDLIASELFGHEKGAFTGATQRRLGRFELAAGGTIFLDEVGELPPETQIALLRVLQEREFERIGAAGSGCDSGATQVSIRSKRLFKPRTLVIKAVLISGVAAYEAFPQATSVAPNPFQPDTPGGSKAASDLRVPNPDGLLSPITRLNVMLLRWIQFGGQFRNRVERQDGLAFAPVNDAYNLTQLRLGIYLQPAKWLQLVGVAQDSRVFFNG